MAEEKTEQESIRLNVVDKFYDKLDGIIEKAYKKDKISYGELDIAFLRMGDKILQQKITLMFSFLKDEHVNTEVEKKEQPHGLYS
jgi:C-terminal processing protease CtpA/Prc